LIGGSSSSSGALPLKPLERLGTAGNLTTDAYLAVLAMERGYVPYSTDVDFRAI
jgi:hypothetical protein